MFAGIRTAFVAVAIMLSLGAFAEVQARYAVAPGGDDAGAGDEAHPFATISRAVQAVRDLERPLRGDVEIVLAGGVYDLASPVELGAFDGGGDGYKVIWRARSGETPVLRGGRVITGWKREAGDIWSVTIEDPALQDCRQLFIGGERRERARLPHTGWHTLQGAADGKLSGWANEVQGDDGDALAKRSFRFQKGDIQPSWHDLESTEVVVLQYWMAARLRVQAVDDAQDSVLFTGGSWRPLTWSFGYYVDNVLEGLDQPGAWYFDRASKILRYHALPGEDLTALEAVVPATESLLQIEGDEASGKCVTDLVFKGIGFKYTAWTLPREGFACAQAELPVAAAVRASWVRRLSIEECSLAHLGGWGIEIGRGCQDVAIRCSTVEDTGAGCIKIGEPQDPGSDEAEACRVTVSDCRLANGCNVYLGSPAVWIGQSGHNVIAHNEFTGQFMWAVSVGWNWSYFPLNRSRENIVEKNHVHDLGTGTLGTHGALYCLGVSPGTVLRNNYIHDVHATTAWGAGEGIILDNGCVGILVENNVVHDADAGGWGCNFNCLGSMIINNVFVNGKRYQLTRYGDAPAGPPPPNGELFARNIVVWKEGPLFNEKKWWSYATLWNQNVYFQSAGEPFSFMKFSFDEWKAMGLDQDSVIADPLFVDPANHNYSLQPESPALKLGFRPIDISDVGPRQTPPAL